MGYVNSVHSFKIMKLLYLGQKTEYISFSVEEGGKQVLNLKVVFFTEFEISVFFAYIYSFFAYIVPFPTPRAQTPGCTVILNFKFINYKFIKL